MIKPGPPIGKFIFRGNSRPIRYALSKASLSQKKPILIRQSLRPGSDKWYYIAVTDRTSRMIKQGKTLHLQKKSSTKKNTKPPALARKVTRKKGRFEVIPVSPTKKAPKTLIKTHKSSTKKAPIVTPKKLVVAKTPHKDKAASVTVPGNKTKLKKLYLAKMKTLWGTYDNKWAFPKWVVKKVQDHWDEIMKPATVYYTKGENLKLVKLISERREPVNYKAIRKYDQGKLDTSFGWRIGGYATHFMKELELAPNIGAYTPSFVNYNGNTNTKVHIYNAIGYAFDEVIQPDYTYFMEAMPAKKRRLTLIKLYVQVFKKIYACAQDKKLTTVIMSLVGGNNFAIRYKDDKGEGKKGLQQHVWVPAFIRALNDSKHMGITTCSMGFSSYINNLLKKHGVDLPDVGLWPNNIDNVNTKTTLFVNAWDPLSVPGNGNEEDDSLDGRFGRLTNIAVNGSPMTNPYINFVAV